MLRTDSRPVRASAPRTGASALALCAVWLMLFVVRVAPALELGDIEARSPLFEPLNARIALHDVGSGDLEGLTIALGTPAQFELAGVAREDVLKLLRFDVVEQDGGRGYVRVWTSEPIIEPTLTFLVSAEWARGRTIRGYRLALPAAGPGVIEAPARVEEPAPPAREDAAREDAAMSSASEPDSPAASENLEARGTSYGPIRKNETLWSIASSVRPDESVSVQHMMLAILEANPDAFAFSNVNALNAGTTLRIPSLAEIGTGDMTAAIAEVRRHHSAWKQRGDSGRGAPAASTEAPPPDDAASEPDGRVELVAPKSAESETQPEEISGSRELRSELALATEEADAARRENNALNLRLAEAEAHIKQLNRLVELKNEEIAALQAELQAMTATDPDAAPVQTEAMPEPELGEEEAKPAMAPADEEPKPAMTPADDESKPVMTPADDEAKPAMTPADEESMPAPAETTALPFDLDALRVNPVLLVGGAGILLILLGVVALLRRRRASTGEEGAADSADGSPAGEDNILLELEAVAADLADDAADSRERRTQTGPTAQAVDGARHSESDALAERQIAKLWRDASETEPVRSDATVDDNDETDSSLSFEALTRDDPESDSLDDEREDEFDIRSLVDDATEPEARTSESDADASGDLESLFREHDVPTVDHEGPGAVSSSGVGQPAEADGDSKREPFLVGSDAGSPGGESATGDDTSEADSAAHALLDDAANDRETSALHLDDVGEDEMQTKIDLAQVYMEMGDQDSARGFLEAVLADGDDDQREAAREMLSKLG